MRKQVYFPQFNFLHTVWLSNSSIWPIDRTLLGATTPCQSGHGRDSNEMVLCIPQIFSITGAPPSDRLVSYPGHLLWRGLTPGQRCSRCFLQLPTQPAELLISHWVRHIDRFDRFKKIILLCRGMHRLRLMCGHYKNVRSPRHSYFRVPQVTNDILNVTKQIMPRVKTPWDLMINLNFQHSMNPYRPEKYQVSVSATMIL